MPTEILPASHAWPSSAQPVHQTTSPSAQVVLLEPPLTPTMSVNVFQVSLKPTEPVKHALPSAMDVKSMVSATPVKILSTENSTKTVTAQPVFMMMEAQPARPAIQSVRLAPTPQPVLHVSPKTIEPWSTVNVSAPVDTIKSSKLTTPSSAENATPNARNAPVQLSVSTATQL